jgi:AbrB family looped-hinge helix DNA binding protein
MKRPPILLLCPIAWALPYCYDEVKKGGRNMISAKLSVKGQLTLPRAVRATLAVGPGDRLVFVVNGDMVSLRALGPSSARALAGSLRQYARKSTGQAAMRAEVKKGVGRAAAQEK